MYPPDSHLTEEVYGHPTSKPVFYRISSHINHIFEVKKISLKQGVQLNNMWGTIIMAVSYLQSMISGPKFWVRLICECDFYGKTYSTYCHIISVSKQNSPIQFSIKSALTRLKDQVYHPFQQQMSYNKTIRSMYYLWTWDKSVMNVSMDQKLLIIWKAWNYTLYSQIMHIWRGMTKANILECIFWIQIPEIITG